MQTRIGSIRALYLLNVAVLIPRLRQTSAVGGSLFYSFKIPMICASVNCHCFMVRLLAWMAPAKSGEASGVQVVVAVRLMTGRGVAVAQTA